MVNDDGERWCNKHHRWEFFGKCPDCEEEKLESLRQQERDKLRSVLETARSALAWCAEQYGQEKVIDLAVNEIDHTLKGRGL